MKGRGLVLGSRTWAQCVRSTHAHNNGAWALDLGPVRDGTGWKTNLPCVLGGNRGKSWRWCTVCPRALSALSGLGHKLDDVSEWYWDKAQILSDSACRADWSSSPWAASPSQVPRARSGTPPSPPVPQIRNFLSPRSFPTVCRHQPAPYPLLSLTVVSP